MREMRVAIVGDYDPAKEYQRATTEALNHSAAALGLPLASDWIESERIESEGSAACLKTYDAVFLGPGAPYRSEDGALAAVRFAREQGWPFFAT